LRPHLLQNFWTEPVEVCEGAGGEVVQTLQPPSVFDDAAGVSQAADFYFALLTDIQMTSFDASAIKKNK